MTWSLRECIMIVCSSVFINTKEISKQLVYQNKEIKCCTIILALWIFVYGIYVFMCVSVCVCIHAYSFKGSSQINNKCHFQAFFTLPSSFLFSSFSSSSFLSPPSSFLRQDVLLAWNLAWNLPSGLGWMANQPKGSACLSFDKTEIRGTWHHIKLLNLNSGDQASDLCACFSGASSRALVLWFLVLKIANLDF